MEQGCWRAARPFARAFPRHCNFRSGSVLNDEEAVPRGGFITHEVRVAAQAKLVPPPFRNSERQCGMRNQEAHPVAEAHLPWYFPPGPRNRQPREVGVGTACWELHCSSNDASPLLLFLTLDFKLNPRN
jgi:hypothetical protein